MFFDTIREVHLPTDSYRTSYFFQRASILAELRKHEKAAFHNFIRFAAKFRKTKRK